MLFVPPSRTHTHPSHQSLLRLFTRGLQNSVVFAALYRCPFDESHNHLRDADCSILPCVCPAVRGPGRRGQHHGITRRLHWPTPLQASSCKDLISSSWPPPLSPPAEKDCPVCLPVWNFTAITSLHRQLAAGEHRNQDHRRHHQCFGSGCSHQQHSAGSTGSPWNNRLETPQWWEVDTTPSCTCVSVRFKTLHAGKLDEKIHRGKKSRDVQIVYFFSFSAIFFMPRKYQCWFWPLNMFPFLWFFFFSWAILLSTLLWRKHCQQVWNVFTLVHNACVQEQFSYKVQHSVDATRQTG